VRFSGQPSVAKLPAGRQTEETPVKFQKKPFRGERIALDGNEYEHCSFESCTFVFSATAPFRLAHNDISADCRFEFTGAAADTVTAMRGIEVARKSMAIVQSGPQSLAGADIQLVSCLTECVDREVLSANVRVR